MLLCVLSGGNIDNPEDRDIQVLGRNDAFSLYVVYGMNANLCTDLIISILKLVCLFMNHILGLVFYYYSSFCSLASPGV